MQDSELGPPISARGDRAVAEGRGLRAPPFVMSQPVKDMDSQRNDQTPFSIEGNNVGCLMLRCSIWTTLLLTARRSSARGQSGSWDSGPWITERWNGSAVRTTTDSLIVTSFRVSPREARIARDHGGDGRRLLE